MAYGGGEDFSGEMNTAENTGEEKSRADTDLAEKKRKDAVIKYLRSQIDRLKSELEAEKERARNAEADLPQLQAENARLRHQLERSDREDAAAQQAWGRRMQPQPRDEEREADLQQPRAENARLRRQQERSDRADAAAHQAMGRRMRRQASGESDEERKVHQVTPFHCDPNTDSE